MRALFCKWAFLVILCSVNWCFAEILSNSYNTTLISTNRSHVPVWGAAELSLEGFLYQFEWKKLRIESEFLNFGKNDWFCKEDWCTLNSAVENLNGDSMSCGTPCRDTTKSVVLTHEKRIRLIEDVLPTLINNLSYHGPLIRRPDSSLNFERGELKPNAHTLCRNIYERDKKEKKAMDDIDVLLYITTTPSSKSNGAVDGIQCVFMEGRAVSLIININPCSLYRDDNIVHDFTQHVFNLLWSGTCPTENALLLPGKNGGSASSVCVSVRCSSDQQVSLRFEGQTKWSECKPGQEISFDALSVICPEFHAICQVQKGEASEHGVLPTSTGGKSSQNGKKSDGSHKTFHVGLRNVVLFAAIVLLVIA